MAIVNLSTWWEFLASLPQTSNTTSGGSGETFANNEDVKNGILAHLREQNIRRSDAEDAHNIHWSDAEDAQLVDSVAFLSLDEYRAQASEEVYSAVRHLATFTVS